MACLTSQVGLADRVSRECLLKLEARITGWVGRKTRGEYLHNLSEVGDLEEREITAWGPLQI